MVYGLNYTQIVSSVDDSGSINVVDDNSNQLTPPPGVEPINRLCENAFTSQSSVNTDGYGVAFGYPNTDFYVGFRSTATTVPIVRMYNGVTMTESNFVGYGVRSNYTQFYSDGNFPEPPVAGIFAPFQTLNVNYIILQSYMDELSPSSTTSAYGYTNLPISGSVNTIPFVCGIEVDEVVTASAANRSVTLGATEETTIDSIEFYTPPT